MRRIKLPTLADIAALSAFILALPFGLVLRWRHPDMWLVSERPREARDNAYWFFKYVHDNALHPNTYYVIKKDAPDARRIRLIASDRLVPFGSLRHYVYYIASSIHISAHVGGGMTSPRVCRQLEVRGLLRNRKAFLRHGITISTTDWAFRKHARIDLILSAADRERQHILHEFGYSEDQVALTGLCRYDQLPSGPAPTPTPSRTILILPTWRKYLAGLTEEQFKASTYFRTYTGLLSSPPLLALLQTHSCRLIFHLHPGMQTYAHLFQAVHESITISGEDNDIQTLLKDSSLLVTDYSSVFFDFAYMRRPVVYYQFDYADFRAGHWPTGYFDYVADGFGPVVRTETDLLKTITELVKAGFTPSMEYAARAESFFAYRDAANCARTYRAVDSLADRH